MTSLSLSAARLAAALFLAVLLWPALLATPGGAQVLPIPGIPGSPGGAGGGPAQPAPETPPPGAPPAGGEQGVTDPTQALIDILRDDAAREALIRELEGATGEAAPGQPAAGQAGTGSERAGGEGAGAAPAPAEAATDDTIGARAVGATRQVADWTLDQLAEVWLRVQRVPGTFATAARAFEDGVLVTEAQRVGALALSIYLSLAVLRLVALPLRRRLVPVRTDWFTRFLRRLATSLIDLVTLPLAVFFGILGLFVLGEMQTWPEDEAQLAESEALFINAFVAVETAVVVLRLVLSPLSPQLRVVPLPAAAIRSLWRVGLLVIYAVGYGQFWVVPVIDSGVSVFVGRAAAAVLSSVVVAGLVVYVIAVRRPVAEWLTADERPLPFAGLLEPLLRRWHWPVLAYLLYVLVTVMTRPGNVLLPLLLTTGEVTLVVLVAAMLFGALSAIETRRARVPAALAEHLPLLEERVNQLLPAVLRIARLAVVVGTLVLVIDIVGLQDVGGILGSGMMERLSSGLLSVLLIFAVLSLVWLGMTSWVDYRLNPFVGKVPTPREITLLTLMKNAATVALVIIGAITSLAQLGMNVGPLIASAGVIGLAISFGAQRMVEDIFSGVFIQAENAMNVGDVVDVGGTVGVVEKLTVRSVTLRDLSGVVHVIPFSSAAKISNYMRDYAYHLADIGVAYREDVEEVRQAMHDAFDELRRDEAVGGHVLDELEWFGLNAFGPSELVLRARIKTAPGHQWEVGRAYNAIVKRLFDERGIEIPFPHRTLYFGEDKDGRAPPMHLRVLGEAAGRDRVTGSGGERAEPSDDHQMSVRDADLPSSDEG